MLKVKLLAATSFALVLASCGGGESEAPIGEPAAKVSAPEGQEWVNVVSKTAEGGYRIGNPDAPIRLVEYASVTCSHCAEFEEEAFGELKSKYIASGQMNFELRNFLLNPYDVPISILTRCGGEGPYLALTEEFYKNQRVALDTLQQTEQSSIQAAFEKPENERFLALAQVIGVIDFFTARGISEDQAKACLSDPKNSKELLDMTQAASDPSGKYKVTGTPSFFLNGAPLTLNATPSVWTQVKTALQNAGAR